MPPIRLRLLVQELLHLDDGAGDFQLGLRGQHRIHLRHRRIRPDLEFLPLAASHAHFIGNDEQRKRNSEFGAIFNGAALDKTVDNGVGDLLHQRRQFFNPFHRKCIHREFAIKRELGWIVGHEGVDVGETLFFEQPVDFSGDRGIFALENDIRPAGKNVDLLAHIHHFIEFGHDVKAADRIAVDRLFLVQLRHRREGADLY